MIKFSSLMLAMILSFSFHYSYGNEHLSCTNFARKLSSQFQFSQAYI